MKAADVMVSNVITAGLDASIGEVAATLPNNHISGAPVVGKNGELVGIVSEGDLMRRPEIGTTKRHSWWLELLSNQWASATEYIKSHSRKVADVMTREVITANPDTSRGDLAERGIRVGGNALASHHIGNLAGMRFDVLGGRRPLIR